MGMTNSMPKTARPRMRVRSIHHAAASASSTEMTVAVSAVVSEFLTAGRNCGACVISRRPSGVILQSMETIGRITQNRKNSARQA